MTVRAQKALEGVLVDLKFLLRALHENDAYDQIEARVRFMIKDTESALTKKKGKANG